MSFYGRPTEEVVPRPYRRFVYRIYDGGQEHEVAAHQISTKAFQVREITGKENE